VELLLIRHALPDTDEADDPADPGLGALGRRQAARLAARLRGEPLDALYSSPLRRATATAAPLASVLGLEIEVVDGLAEWDRDADAYVPVEELRRSGDERWQAMVGGDLRALGIDVDAFRTRVDAAFAGIVSAHPGGRVAVVCHGGVINAHTATIVGIDRLLWFEPGYTSVSRVLVSRRGDRGLLSLNDTAHLETPRRGP